MHSETENYIGFHTGKPMKGREFNFVLLITPTLDSSEAFQEFKAYLEIEILQGKRFIARTGRICYQLIVSDEKQDIIRKVLIQQHFISIDN